MYTRCALLIATEFQGWVEGGSLLIKILLLLLLFYQEGYCKVLAQAERSSYSRPLFAAEEASRSSRKRVWENYTEPDEKEEEEEDGQEEESVGKDSKPTNGSKAAPIDRKVDYRKVRLRINENEWSFCAVYYVYVQFKLLSFPPHCSIRYL